MIYLIGRLADVQIPHKANQIQKDTGEEVFTSWFSPGPDADQYWAAHEKARGRSYVEAINGPHAHHIFAFDRRFLDECRVGVIWDLPGKSAYAELGYLAGMGKPAYVLLTSEPDRWDLMLRFATGITNKYETLLQWLRAS